MSSDVGSPGDTAFISRLQPGNLDTLHLNGSRFIGNPDMIDGDELGLMFHAQIDGTGTPWAVAGLGTTTATNRALVRGNAVELRKGGVVDGVTVVVDASVVVAALVDSGAEAVIAGCTEVPLLLGAKDVSVPLFDSAEVLARACVERCR